MKIFYGVQGTGNGHISRARSLSTALSKLDTDVDYLFSGRPREQFFDMEQFGDWQCKRGLTFVTERGRINPVKTVLSNNLVEFTKDLGSLDLSGYDMVISDFEPVTAWAAKRQGVKCYGIGHQYAFGHNIPKEGVDINSRILMNYFAPTHYAVGLHWHHFGHPILPPIIDVDHHGESATKDKVLVYLGFEMPEDVIPLLQLFRDKEFYYYGNFKEPVTQENVHLRPLSRDGFKRDLSDCEGVICNAGFELASEALHFGKKLLVKPLLGQMEQLSNALAMEELGLGHRMNTLDPFAIRRWLDSDSASPCEYPDVAKAIAEWLVDPNRPSIESLSEQLWSQTRIRGEQQSLNLSAAAV